MKPLTVEWIAKAEGDFATMEREACVAVRPNHDAFCLHAQQCVEKYLKGRLVEAGKPCPWVHDLVMLIDSVAGLEPSWAAHRDGLAALSEFARNYRYPGASATAQDAEEAASACRAFRAAARQALGLED